MTPPTPPDARRITPDCQPEFPCWIEYYNSFKEPHWGRFENDPRSHFPEFENDWIRWHPDQPTAPAPILCSSQASAPGEIPGGSVNNPEGLHQLPPTQPPAPLAGGTAVYPSTAPAEVAAGCKEGRPVSPATGGPTETVLLRKYRRAFLALEALSNITDKDRGFSDSSIAAVERIALTAIQECLEMGDGADEKDATGFTSPTIRALEAEVTRLSRELIEDKSSTLAT